MAEREIEIERDSEGILVFRIRGNMDMNPAVYDVLDAAKEQQLDRVLVDLSRLDFGSAALKGVLAHLHQQVQDAQGRLALVKAPSHFHRQLEISELTDHFDIYEDEAAARSGLSLE